MDKFAEHIAQAILNGNMSTNIEDRTKRYPENEYDPNDPTRWVGDIVMGKGGYKNHGGGHTGPLGWDYDSLNHAMTSMGYGKNFDMMPDDTQSELMRILESRGAGDELKAQPIIQDFMQELDPYNQPVKGMPPLAYDEDLSDQPEIRGYWDAQNWGNHKGSSYQIDRGKIIPIDPVGNGPNLPDFIQAILGMQPEKPDPEIAAGQRDANYDARYPRTRG